MRYKAPLACRGNLLSAISKIAAATIAASTFLSASEASCTPLLPNTKIRLTLVQWMPTKSSYEQWPTVGGEYTVSEEGMISLPLLGDVSVRDKDEGTLASAIARQLKEKIGLVDEPAATIQILSYPPIYVIGDVAKPGEYEFHTGITALQALAMSGGQLRSLDSLQNSQGITKLVGEIREINDSIIRSSAKIERLEAEMAGERTIQPKEDRPKTDAFSNAIYKQEEVIFSARANELARQSKSLTDLRDLLSEEIDVLQEKIKSTDLTINSIQQQLESTINLIERGALNATRQADVERTMRDYRINRLDLTVAITKARQGISEATRDLEGLYDRRQTEVATELQSERATLTQLRLKRDTLQTLLIDSPAITDAMHQDKEPKLQFVLVRRAPGTNNTTEIASSEMTALLPGDVLKVVQTNPARPSPQAIVTGISQ
ncbi:polysaccharide biosynthesis/export family protein [Rhizobium sp. RHZ01]|uniref:polysaccharide biosynthesis/export family protein n=1 Tax=Rhizobium sp. RHZ01 TaxID=2769304 RepID=UPI001FEFADAC|nr:polysaccharide biosynthesis/export family protein [Rhizobium sp. RHZ01]